MSWMFRTSAGIGCAGREAGRPPAPVQDAVFQPSIGTGRVARLAKYLLQFGFGITFQPSAGTEYAGRRDCGPR
jgi:hypothetical protein